MASNAPQSPPALNSSPTLPTQSTTTAKVVNPYLKVSAKKDRCAVASPKTKLMQKYSIRCRDRVMSTSAMELLRVRRRWRGLKHHQERSKLSESRQEQGKNCATAVGDSRNNSLYESPRLFLFSRRVSESKAIKNYDRNANNNNQGNCSNHDPNSNPARSSFDKEQEEAFLLEDNITELSGEAGSGKTQICLSVCVDCVTVRPAAADLADNNGMRPERPQTRTSTLSQQNAVNFSRSQHTSHYKAVYISTRSNSSTIAKRLECMVRSRLMNQMKERQNPPSCIASSITNEQIRTILSRIYLVSMKNEEDLLGFIQHSLPSLLARGGHDCRTQTKAKIGVIVIDDIASLIRFSDPSLYYSSNSNATFHRDRNGNLFFISSQLRKLANLHHVPILVTNQVSAAVGSSLLHWCHSSNKEGFVPALGLVWSYCVGMRIILRRNTGGTAWSNGDEKKEQLNSREGCYGSLRYARVIKAVNMPREESEVQFVIGVGEVAIVS